MNPNAIAFVESLQALPRMPAVFNPWTDVDPIHDIGERSPQIRAEQLTQYLSERIGRARWVLCAEALSYQGGHFSGIAMTSERILLGHQSKRGVLADDVIKSGGQRTSIVTKVTPKLGATERTATIVWGALKSGGIDTREVALWNAFAPHPMKGDGEWLSNRTPSRQELKLGRPLLEKFLTLFPGAKTIAIGQVSGDILRDMGVAVTAQVRHPANGGATEFRDGIKLHLRN